MTLRDLTKCVSVQQRLSDLCMMVREYQTRPYKQLRSILFYMWQSTRSNFKNIWTHMMNY